MRGGPAAAGEAVVLIHGLWMNRVAMWPLAHRLGRCGFAVHRWGYPSLRRGFADNAARLDRRLRAIEGPRVHLVAHSLGGLILRALFHFFPQPARGRIVTLGTPHGGSEVAARLARSPPGRLLLGRCGRELAAGLPLAWPLPAAEIGVVAGTRAVGIGRVLVPTLALPCDGTVTVAEAAYPGAADTVALPVSHTGLLLSGRVAAQVACFLTRGRFASTGAGAAGEW